MRPLQILLRERPDAIFIGPDAFFTARRVQLALLAAFHAVARDISAARHLPKPAG